MSDSKHNEMQEMLGAYALGALTAVESQEVSAYLVHDQQLQTDLAAMRIAVLALPLIVEEVEPPASLRASIMAAIEQEPRIAKIPAASTVPHLKLVPPPAEVNEPDETGSSYPKWLPWALAAAFLLFSLGMVGWNQLSDDNVTTPATIALQSTDPNLATGGEAEFLKDSGVLLVHFHDLPAVAQNEVYQVWLISGETVSSAGVFPAGTTDFAVAADPANYDLIAVSVEPGPVGVPVATNPPILTGDLSVA